MKKLLILLLFIPIISFSQNKLLKFSTFYTAVNGGTSISDIETFSVANGLETSIIQTPYDYTLSIGIRKIARFGYENKAQTFYDGTETSWSDGANIGKRDGLEYLFEVTYKRQMGEEFMDQNHFVRWVSKQWILKGEYLEDGFADISYFETSERYRLKLGKLSFNIGAAQRLSEPYGYDPLAEWVLDNGGIHYTYLALEEGYNVDVYNSIYTDPDGAVVATNSEVWEAVVIPEVLANYTNKKRNELDRTMLHSVVLGFDFYHYKQNFWLHAWGNLMPYHYDDGSEFSYHNYIEDDQWYDYSGGLIFGYKLNKNLGTFLEGKYNKYWNREWYNFKLGINYTIF